MPCRHGVGRINENRQRLLELCMSEWGDIKKDPSCPNKRPILHQHQSNKGPSKNPFLSELLLRKDKMPLPLLTLTFILSRDVIYSTLWLLARKSVGTLTGS